MNKSTAQFVNLQLQPIHIYLEIEMESIQLTFSHAVCLTLLTRFSTKSAAKLLQTHTQTKLAFYTSGQGRSPAAKAASASLVFIPGWRELPGPIFF